NTWTSLNGDLFLANLPNIADGSGFHGVMAVPDPRTIFTNGRCEIDLDRSELRVAGAAVSIGSRPFEVLETLVRAAGKLVTKNELIERVWRGAAIDDNTIQVHISALRKALGEDRVLLKTISRRGYRLMGNWMAQREIEYTPGKALHAIRA